jgi:hypothetical protein
MAYKLTPYGGSDVERTYCDAHARFGKDDCIRIPDLLRRGVMLGLWSDHNEGDVPTIAVGSLNSELPTLAKPSIMAIPSFQETLSQDMFWSEPGRSLSQKVNFR